MNLTVLIITKNAEDTLGKTLASVVNWTDSIIVVDDYSADRTKKIANDYNSTIINHRANNLGEHRAFALTQVNTEWTLVLDSDEILTSENKIEIETAIQNSMFDGYYLRFRNHLFGKKLQHGELHKKLVLFKTRKAHISEKEVHEQYEIEGKVGELSSEVLHYSYRSISQIIWKFFGYSVKQAKQHKKEKKQYGVRELLLNPFHMFYARYILDGGYKDGLARIFLDYEFAHMEFLSYFLIPFVREKRRISVDCGSYDVTGIVQSGIDRVIQGMSSQKNDNSDYYWFSFAKTSLHKLPTRFYSQLWLPLKTILNRCDVFLGTAGHIPKLLGYFPIRKILFLYDFGFFSSPDKYGSSAKKLQIQTESSIKRADTVVLLHSEMYTEFANKYPQYSYKAVTISAGANHLENVEEVPVNLDSNKPFILFVGVVKPVKRLDKILSAIGNSYCVIVGTQEEEYIKTLHLGKKQNVQFIKRCSDGQLKWLYKKAEVMLYTSDYEGFCYPVLEALTLRLPVIALDLPIFHEYQQYFPHLTLVKTVEEMKYKLQTVKRSNAADTIPNDHSYKWTNFNERLVALWQMSHLPKHKSEKIGFIVVLYKTTSDEKKRLEREIRQIGLSSISIYWIDNSSNGKGYGAGINEGIQEGLRDDCDLFIAVNPDISLASVTEKKIREVASKFDVWGLGMKQNNTVYYGGEIDKWRLSGGLIQKKSPHQFVAVDFVSGSLIGFSKEVIQTIGLWSEDYFMYYEDVDYCVRAQKAGFQVGIDSTVIYDHFETSQKNKKKGEWIAKSRGKFFWKYANWKQKIREVVRLPKTMIEISRLRQN